MSAGGGRKGKAPNIDRDVMVWKSGGDEDRVNFAEALVVRRGGGPQRVKSKTTEDLRRATKKTRPYREPLGQLPSSRRKRE